MSKAVSRTVEASNLVIVLGGENGSEMREKDAGESSKAPHYLLCAVVTPTGI